MTRWGLLVFSLLLMSGLARAGEFNSVLNVGDPAPVWSDLPGTDGKTHSLAALARAAVLLRTAGSPRGNDGPMPKSAPMIDTDTSETDTSESLPSEPGLEWSPGRAETWSADRRAAVGGPGLLKLNCHKSVAHNIEAVLS